MSDTNSFDTSAGHSEIKKINAVCALYIHLLVLLHQKHSLCNMVSKFSCSNNINATNSMVHWGYFTMILDVASGLLATYFIYIRGSNRTDCFH